MLDAIQKQVKLSVPNHHESVAHTHPAKCNCTHTSALLDSVSEQDQEKAHLLFSGAIRAPCKRTITSALRVRGLSDDAGFAMYHHFLNRTVFSSLQLSRVLLVLLIQHLARSDEPMVLGIDETIERSRGRRINALGVYQGSSALR